MVSTSLHSSAEWDGVPPLPAPLTPLIGREREAARVDALLRGAAVRLLTLSGPGGVGKTRLALHVAAMLDPDALRRPQAATIATPFPAGVGFAPLASTIDPRLIASSIARSLKIPHDDVPAFDALVDTLGTRRMLLVLDNFEQLLTSASFVSELLAACPSLKVLVTSRSLLRISGEHDVRVAPLDVPVAGSGASLAEVARAGAALLFMERSRAVLAEGEFTDEDAPAIADICARLDGLPLAIELAAARVSILSPQMLADRLDRRLPMLTGGARDLPARQQTLHDTIAWSDDLLSPAERWLFHRLAVFSGGFTLEAAAALLAQTPFDDEGTDVSRTAWALETVASLVGHSLLLRADPAGGEPRFAMLGTLREYATDRLRSTGELHAVRRQHAEWVLGLARRAMSEFSGPDQRVWIERTESDHDNVRAALTWSLEHDPDLALQLSSSLWRFWEIRGFLLEGQSWIARALAERGTAADRPRATALNNLGNLTYRLADYAQARDLYHQSLAINRELGDQTDVADSLNNLGLVAGAQGDYMAARAFLHESLGLRRQEDRPDRLSLGLHNLGEMEIDAGQAEEALPLLDEALTLRTRRGDDRGAAYVRYNLGRAKLALGDVAAGETELCLALATFREVGEKIGMADALIEIGLLALNRGDDGDAVASLDEGLKLMIDVGDKRGALAGLEVVAYLAVARGEQAAAARLLGAAAQQREVLHIPPPVYGRGMRARANETAQRSLGPTALAGHRAAGGSWTLAHAVDCAFAELSGDPKVTARGRPGEEDAAPLTARERDVLRLLVRGLGDREIAAELSISPRTVSTHVTNILRKLGEGSRTAAAAYAVRHDLT